MKTNMQNVFKLRDKAEKFFEKGKFEKALHTYEEIRVFGNSDPKIYMRLGDINRKLQHKDEAIKAYKDAVNVFARQGFDIKAIAVCKIITGLDPTQKDIQKKLAKLLNDTGRVIEPHVPVAPPTVYGVEEEAPAEVIAEEVVRPEDRVLIMPSAEEEEEEAAEIVMEDVTTKPDGTELVMPGIGTAAEEDDDEGPLISPDEIGLPPTPKAKPKATQAKSTKREFPRTPLFSDFNREELFDVVSKVIFREVPMNKVVFKEGDSGDSIFIVVSGELDIKGNAKDGSIISIDSLKEGDFFGEFGFFAKPVRKTTVATLTPVELLELKKSDMDEIIKKHPRVSKVMFEFYKERVADRYMALSKAFRPMSPHDRKEVLKRVTLKQFGENQNIITEGEKGDTMYLIKTGEVYIWKSDGKGGETHITDLKDGDFFGEIALATNKPRTASVTAHTDVEVIEFSRRTIKDILAKYPDIKDILLGVIKERVEDADRFK